MRKKIIISVLILTFAISSSYAQKKYKYAVQASTEKLLKNPIDTINANDGSSKKIILLSNGTWKYYEPGLKERLDDCSFLHTHWDTTSLFCWKDVSLNDLPTLIDLRIIDSLEQYHYPVMGNVYSKYGMRKRHVHNGVDISPLTVGTALYATFEGRVRYAKYNTGGYGYLVIIRHPNGLESWYAHLCKIVCSVGDYVSAGQIIGYSGNTGRSSGPHLHFELRYKDQTFDPEFLIDFPTGNLKFQTFQLERKFFNIHSRASEMLEEDDDDINDDGQAVIDSFDDDENENSKEEAKTETKTESDSNEGPQYHIIKSGDTLGRLAVKYHTTVDKLCKLNNLTKTSMLHLNQKIRLR